MRTFCIAAALITIFISGLAEESSRRLELKVEAVAWAGLAVAFRPLPAREKE